MHLKGRKHQQFQHHQAMVQLLMSQQALVLMALLTVDRETCHLWEPRRLPSNLFLQHQTAHSRYQLRMQKLPPQLHISLRQLSQVLQLLGTLLVTLLSQQIQKHSQLLLRAIMLFQTPNTKLALLVLTHKWQMAQLILIRPSMLLQSLYSLSQRLHL